MALSLHQVQKQTQRLIMTPQMQQSIQLLQMNAMDLEMLIREEMLENPFLELTDDEEALQSDLEAGADGDDAAEPVEPESGTSEQDQAAAPTEADGDLPEPRLKSDEPSDPAENAEGSEEYERLNETDVNWDEEYSDSDTSAYSGTREDAEEHDFTTYTKLSESLYDSMMRQLRLSVLGGRDYEIGEFIIGNLNANGYLDCSLENLALMVGYPPEMVIPGGVGTEEEADRALRQMLATLHGANERPEAFVGMKRRELVARVISLALELTYDEVAPMKPEERLRRLIAKRMKRKFEKVAGVPESELVLDVIAFRLKTKPDRVFDVLEIIQEFEPTGVAARNLSECLRLQAEEQGIRNRLLYRILDDHLADLQQKRFKEISRALEVPEEQVVEVFQLISHMNPKPGSGITRDTPQYISPDVYVKKVDGKYMYYLNEGDVGRLKVAANYRRLMAKRGRKDLAPAANNGASVGAVGAERVEPKSDADYAHEKYKSAVWLIRNIEKRKGTILRVTESIMEYQKEFLDKGIEHLRPLTLSVIADRVQMHESTIARVTTRKYVETPRGLFELKYFFSSGLETDDGEAASSRSIKELLTQLIEAEDKRRPLSDQKLADMLKARGTQIARRTVAKYREQIKILPAKLRKQVERPPAGQPSSGDTA